ncbi:MAG TPA: hypothetical protein VGS80_02370, partial [Ktedonobacterales bacterium]|nr:hypothetical protein [Ktedonobacterales bacterium]
EPPPDERMSMENEHLAQPGTRGAERRPAALDGIERVLRRITFGLPVFGRRRSARERYPSNSPLALFRRYNRAYFRRWLLIGALIGVVAGIGAIVFAAAIAQCTRVLLDGIAGFAPPQPAGEGITVLSAIEHRWLIPVVTTLGGLLTLRGG